MTGTARRSVAVIGIGNDLAGDDGAGLEVIRRLEAVWGRDERVLLGRLEGDLFAIADLLPLAGEFLFVDAVAGDVPGRKVRGALVPRAFAPSLHQTDVASVMQTLENLGMIEPFPRWSLWGVTILPPKELRCGLSEPVAKAVGEIARELDRRLLVMLGGP